MFAVPSKATPPIVLAVANLVAATAVSPAYRAPTFDAVRVMLAVPSKATPEIVRAVASLVAVAALPVVLWLPVVFTPGRLIFAVPSKDTPPIVRAVASLVAATAVAPAYRAPTSAAVGFLSVVYTYPLVEWSKFAPNLNYPELSTPKY